MDDRPRAEELARSFRDSPEAARRLCTLIGTSRLTADLLQRNVDLVARLPDVEQLRTQSKRLLVEKAARSLSWREGEGRQQAALQRWKGRNLLGVMARDILGSAGVAEVGHDVTVIAEAALEVALQAVEPAVPFSVIALGRFGGGELSYASDLDIIFAFEGAAPDDHAEGLRVASAVRRFMQGATPASRLWEVDVDLRPEGKQGLLARSVEGYRRYFAGWALMWERQAMMRARPVAGDHGVAAALMDVLDEHVWQRRPHDRRRARDPAAQGPHRARAHPGGRRPAVPPQARPGLAVRRGVDGAAAPADPRRAGDRHHGGARPPAGRRACSTPPTTPCWRRRTGSAS